MTRVRSTYLSTRFLHISSINNMVLPDSNKFAYYSNCFQVFSSSTMEATSFSLCIANYNQSFPSLTHKQSFPGKPLGRKSVACNNKLSVSAAREGNNQDYEGKPVDDNMIVLRMRIRDLKMSEETQHAPPPNWMEWEKQYYGKRYNEDVCEAIGLLQMCLMNTRPCLALGMLALIALSVPISISVVIFYVLELANKGFLVPFHR